MKLFTRKSGSGKPLIILHGVFGMSDNWMTLSKQFAEKGFYVIAADTRNHGQSLWSNEMNYQVMVEDLVELLNDEGLQKASILGHSMGGKIAMNFACLHPEKIDKLIVADMSPSAYEDTNADVIAALNAIDLTEITSRKEAETRMRELLKNEGTIQFLLKSLTWKDSQLEWKFNWRTIADNAKTLGEKLPENYTFNGPALFIRGENSQYITTEDTPLIKKHFPKAEIVTVPNAGHWVHADNPSGFMQAALQFLST